MGHLPCEYRLRAEAVQPGDTRRLWGDTRVAFQYLEGAVRGKGTGSSGGSVVMGQGEMVSN